MTNGTPKERGKTERRFYNANGDESARAQHDTERMTVTFLGDEDEGAVLEMPMSQLKREVMQAAAGFGIMTSVTNAAGGSNPNASPYERASDRWATLVEGQWTGERESGPRIGDIVTAAASLGYDEETVRAKLVSNELSATQLMKNAAIEAAVLKIRAARAADRQRSAEAKAGAAKGDLDALLG